MGTEASAAAGRLAGAAAAAPRLPPAFLERMEALLGEELGRFAASFAERRSRALRLNPEKTNAAELGALLGLELTPLPWGELGYALPPEAPPLGAHPAHLAGLFYLQEPSSLSVAEICDPQPGWRVADLAAAPGGKATHLAALVGRGGAVVANELSPARLRALHENLDRLGVGVASSRLSLAAFADAVSEPFDAVVLDAPCTGEALFRRDPRLVREWSPAAVRGAARRQVELLAQAARVVRPGGLLVYSTCSFELAENEEVVAALLARAPGFRLEDAARLPALERGRPLAAAATELTARVWPHRGPGEGQFVARLRRADGEPSDAAAAGERPRAGRRTAPGRAAAAEAWRAFAAAFAPAFAPPAERLELRGLHVFLRPERTPGLEPAALARPGLPLGTARPGRFEPAPALATSIDPELVRARVSLAADDPRLPRYLRGETIEASGGEGWVLVCYERFGLGWGRRGGGRVKNFFPRALRAGGRG